MVVVKTLSELLSPEAYGEKEKAEKNEYIQGKLVQMDGASANHHLIANNFSTLLWNLLTKKGYKIYQGDLRVINEDRSSFVYPDIVVVKGEPEFADTESDTIFNPMLVVEVLSEKTAELDRTAKFEIYQGISSVQEYVLVYENKYGIERYFRNGDEWLYTSRTGIQSAIPLKSIDLQIELQDIYEAVEFRSANTFGKK
ncbi:MAG: Uma2 family endonuclease [Flammeovirgaceae bacterium]